MGDPVEFLMNEYNLSPPEKARAMLGRFNLPGASHLTKIGYLSGGQKARVAFAALCAANPHIIVLDEPTNHLDIESVEALISAIKNYDGGVILVSHDARLIEQIDCEIWVCEAGTCYRYEKGFHGYKDRILREVAEREEQIEKMAAKKAAERAAAREKHMRKDASGNVIKATPKASAPKPIKAEPKEEPKSKKEEEQKAGEEEKASKKKSKEVEVEEQYDHAEEEEEEKPKKKKKKKYEEEEEEYVYEEEEKPKKKKKKKEEEEEEYVYEEEEEEKPKKKKKKKKSPRKRRKRSKKKRRNMSTRRRRKKRSQK